MTMEQQGRIPVFARSAEFIRNMEMQSQFKLNCSVEESTVKSRSWKRYLRDRTYWACYGLLWLLAIGVFVFSGCVKHPHGAYETQVTKIPVVRTENISNTVDDLISNVELYRVGTLEGCDVYENAVYFDRMMSVNSISIQHSMGLVKKIFVNKIEIHDPQIKDVCVKKLTIQVMMETKPEGIQVPDKSPGMFFLIDNSPKQELSPDNLIYCDIEGFHDRNSVEKMENIGGLK